MRETPWTAAESSALPEEEKATMLRQAKLGTWYDGWKPYCGQVQARCSMPRMTQEHYGFRCPECGNMIAWDLTRLAESPLNRKKEASNQQQGMIHPYPAPIAMVSGTDSSSERIATALRGMGMRTTRIHEIPTYAGMDLVHGYMRAPELSSAIFSMHDLPDPTAEWLSPDERDEYSRMKYPTVGPAGYPTRHRRNRKIRKNSRRQNRRK